MTEPLLCRSAAEAFALRGSHAPVQFVDLGAWWRLRRSPTGPWRQLIARLTLGGERAASVETG